MKTRVCHLPLISILAFLLLPVSASAVPFDLFANTVPDFFQHQTGINFPGGVDGGCCYLTSFLDELYYLDKKYSDSNLYVESQPNMAAWLDDMIANTNKVGFSAPNVDYYQGYLNTVDPGKWIVSEEDTDLFSNYENWFSRGDGVLIFLGPGSGSFWWSYHVLAAAGYEQVNQNGEDVLQLYFADPDTTSKPIDAQHPNPGFCGNLPADLQPFCIPTGNYNAADNFPWGGPIGTYDKSYYQECVINAAGIVQADPGNICLYAGAQVTSLFDIHPTPEPISLSLFATGLGLMAWRWRGRKSSQASAQ